MKNHKILVLFNLFLFISLFSITGCNAPVQKQTLSAAQKILKEVRTQDVAKFYTEMHGTITNKSNIVLFASAGPQFSFTEESERQGLLPIASNNDYAILLIPQEQTIRSMNEGIAPTDEMLTEKQLKKIKFTHAEATEINLYSIAKIYAVAEYFKKKGHKVIIFGVSFGAFLVTEMYRQYDDKPFHKVLIGVGRLDMPKELVDNYIEVSKDGSKNAPKAFGTDGQKIIVCTSLPEESAEICKPNLFMRLMLRLTTDLGKNQYTTLLARKNLGKVIYYFGKKDRQVGKLTNEEITFLKSHGATVKPSENGHNIRKRADEIKADIIGSFSQ